MDMRIAGEVQTQREIIDRAMMQMNTCIPGVIESFDTATQTASVVPAITMRTNIDGEAGYLELPKIISVPIVFPFAATSGFAITLPIKKGDPCLLVFSQRAIDNWHLKGDIQPPEEGTGSRHHDLTDAFAMFAPSPLPLVLGSWETEGIEIRNRAKTSRITIKNGTIDIETVTQVTLTAPLTQVNGDMNVSGTITAGVDVITNSKHFKTHVHGGVYPGSGNTGGPV